MLSLAKILRATCLSCDCIVFVLFLSCAGIFYVACVLSCVCLVGCLVFVLRWSYERIVFVLCLYCVCVVFALCSSCACFVFLV